MLEGPKEPLEDVDVCSALSISIPPRTPLTHAHNDQWHPTRPMIASVSSHGHIHIWATQPIDSWSAFAPGFEELEENQIYQEKEDEFDIVRRCLSLFSVSLQRKGAVRRAEVDNGMKGGRLVGAS